MSNEEQQSDNKHRQHPVGNHSFQTISQQQASAGPTTTTTALISATSATRRAGQFKCVGAIRKAGFLSVKKWILKRRQSIELARKQGWKRYWVCLRGTALLFHSVIDKRNFVGNDENDEAASSMKDCIDLLAWIKANCCAGGQKQLLSSLMAQQQQQQQGNSGNDMNEFLKNMAQCYIESEPRHLIIIEGAIVQPIPEHPKRDHVFCLSTTFGDAYLFQATCQLESDNWISAIHNACAASLARDLTRDEAMKLFEAKVRHLELEAEKKLFLRQRLESRLTTMNSIGGVGTTGNINSVNDNTGKKNVENSFSDNKKATLRSLLCRLAQQLVALDNYLEQVHCEIYQLRCYLYSCGAQHQFYQNLLEAAKASGGNSSSTAAPAIMSIELPHPKSLLMHVCRQTKLFLIKLGVFTVSSFHAYLHARQGSADSILQRIQQQQQSDNQQQATNLSFELRSRALSISEKLLSHVNQELETNTEELIHLSNLRSISIHLAKSLFKSIRQISPTESGIENQLPVISDTEDGHSIRDHGETVIINLKVHSSSSSASIIKQVLKILQDNNNKSNQIYQSELNYLNYYLRFETTSSKDIVAHGNDKRQGKKDCFVIAKRRETLNDWLGFEYLELMEKIIFRVQLSRKRLDEEASPFGIAIGAQLILGHLESQLNVYCSYIEWGSVADMAGLKDDDELLVINGIPVMDLDMMFVECILQDEQSLKLVVRACRLECPANSELLDRSNYWRPTDGGGRANDNSGDKPDTSGGNGDHTPHGAGSQVISDEYISSLVCPPPPAKSSAFMRLPETTLLRQKSDMGGSKQADNVRETCNQQNNMDRQPAGLVVSQTSPALAVDERINQQPLHHSTKSQQDLSLDSSLNLVDEDDNGQEIVDDQRVVNADQLAGQLLRKTGHITRLLMAESSDWNSNKRKSEMASATDNENKSKEETSAKQANEIHEEFGNDVETGEIISSQKQIFADPNSIERLRKSILELLETEYAYIRHLETISEHYMVPLEETSYLNISDLRLLSQTVIDLIAFQKDFFDKMTGSVWAKCELNKNLLASTTNTTNTSNNNNNSKMLVATDESEELNKIVQQLELFETIDHFKPLILSLAKTFISEADRFKIYAAYCVAYSRLQKFLHPKRSNSNSACGGFNNTGFSSISTIPTTLDTFLTSSGAGISSPNLLTGSSQPREFFKPLGSFMANNSGISILQNYNNNNNNNSNSNQNSEFGIKLRQLSEFLGNLDSSSSSASLSLPKSSISDLTPHSVQIEPSQSSSIIGKRSPKGTGSGSPMPPFQKSAHQQNFESYLIKPIQRIVKYPMLLNSIAASAQIYEDEELDSELQVAIKQMGSTTSYVNDAQRIHDEYGQVFEQIERQFKANQPQQLATELTNSLSRSSGQFTTTSTTTAATISGSGLPHQPPISLAIEQLLHFGAVNWLNISEFTQNSKLKNGLNLSHMLFVFESCVVFICKEKIVTRANSSNKKKFSPNLATTTATTTTTNTNVINQGNSANNLIETNNSTTIGSGLTSASNKAFTQQKPTNYSINTTDQASSYIIRYQSLIPVSEVQVRSVPTTTTSASTNQFQWELFRCSSVNSNSSLLTKSNNKRQVADKNNSNNNTGKVYLLSSATNDIRNSFLRKIRFIIRESVRNMSLPLARSPSSKSLTPKKMSSPSLATNTNSSCSTSLSPVCNSGENCHKRQQEMRKHEAESGLTTAGTEPDFVASNRVVCDNNNKLYKTSIEVNN